MMDVIFTTPNILITVLFAFLFSVTTLFFLVIGLRGIVFKKPFVISSRWLLILVLLSFTPAMLPSITFSGLNSKIGHLAIVRWLSPAMLIVLGIFLYFSLKSYIAFGITDVSLREGLMVSLRKLNLPHEETRGTVRLTITGADLLVSVQSWLGTGQLKMKQREFRKELSSIVNGMNEYYQSGAVSSVNLTCCIFYTVIGTFLAVFTGAFLFGFGKVF